MWDNYGRYQDGLARADAAEQTFRDEVQMFIARVVERYAGVLSARRLADVLAAEGDDLKRQRDQLQPVQNASCCSCRSATSCR